MNISKKIKSNWFVRGFYELYSTYFGNCKRKKFGYIADSALLIPPLKINGSKNVFLYENTKG